MSLFYMFLGLKYVLWKKKRLSCLPHLQYYLSILKLSKNGVKKYYCLNEPSIYKIFDVTLDWNKFLLVLQ